MAAGMGNRFTNKHPCYQFVEIRWHMGREEGMENTAREFRRKVMSYFDYVEKMTLKIFTQKNEFFDRYTMQ